MADWELQAARNITEIAMKMSNRRVFIDKIFRKKSYFRYISKLQSAVNQPVPGLFQIFPLLLNCTLIILHSISILKGDFP